MMPAAASPHMWGGIIDERLVPYGRVSNPSEQRLPVSDVYQPVEKVWLPQAGKKR